MRSAPLSEYRDGPYGGRTLDRLYTRAIRAHRRRREKSEISCCLKYFLFGFNFIFTVFGLLFVAAGVWAWSEKELFKDFHVILKDFSKIVIDPVLFFVLAGALMFIIGFLGCTGSLRENTTMLCLFSGSIALIFCCELAFCVLVFVYKNQVIEHIKSKLSVIIKNYRENMDLRDLIDWIQGYWLQCCGIDSLKDWELNMYFNCSSPSAEKCGVPPSCCKVQNPKELDLLCGRNIRHESMTRYRLERVYTIGCVYAGEKWLEKHLIPVAVIFVALAILQIFAICLAQNLRSDVFAQRAKWTRLSTVCVDPDFRT